MKNYVYKGISLILVLTMSMYCFTGCGSKADSNKEVVKDNADTENVDLEALFADKVATGKDTDKNETVYIEMKADGTVTQTTVSDVLKVSGKDNISDYSKLDNITNIGGDERFTKDADGNLIWENKGSDIKYQGTANTDAPIDINVKYYLDDKEITADKLAGKSGKVRIAYNYENKTSESEEFVPFLVLTGMILDTEAFKNIEVENGKLIESDGKSIAVGYVLPGLKDEILHTVNHADDYIGDIEMPESFTVTAEVKDFELGMTLSAATSKIGEMDLKETLDFSDIESQMNELQDGADSLVDGAKELNDGAGDLKSGSAKLKDGAADLKKYMKQLCSGTGELKTNYTVFNKSLLDGLKSANGGAKQVYSGTKELDKAAGTLDSGANQLATGISTAKSAFEDVTKADGTVESQGLDNGAKILAEGVKSANKGVQQVVETMQKTPDLSKQQIDGILEQVKAATGGAIASEKALNATVEAINTAVKNGMDLNTVLAANYLNAEAYYSLVQAYYSIQTLESVKSSFEAQVEAGTKDMQELLLGMNALESGASVLSGGVTQVYNGLKQLDTGATNLAEGTAKLKVGTSDLKTGMKELSDGISTLYTKIGDASPKIKTATSQINTATKKINDGTNTLASGVTELNSGIISLTDGTKQLKDGTIELNEEGISRITDIFGKDAKEAVNEIQNILNAGKNYNSFSGMNNEMSGEVKFIYKTEEIKAVK